jgi:hypothetical protein
MKKCKFKKFQLVQFKLPKGCQPSDFPFLDDSILLFLGEIVQMPGHCAVVGPKGQVYWGYHTDNFVEPDEDKI